MEFPNLGQNCSLKECHRLDFLPTKCSACKQIFCNEHYLFQSHSCPNENQNDHQVPICPLCNKPVPLKYGESFDLIVGTHIDQNCEFKQERVFKNRCSMVGCKRRELMPLKCDQCDRNHCIVHRHPTDHQCQRAASFSNNDNSKKANSFTRVFNFNQNSKPPSKSFSIPATLNSFTQKSINTFENIRNNVTQSFQQELASGQNFSSRQPQNRTSSTTPATSANVANFQGDLTEEEALSIAIQESLSTTEKSNQNRGTPSNSNNNNNSNNEKCSIT